mgnify:CR=1 FL=1
MFAELVQGGEFRQLGVVEFDLEERFGHENRVHHRERITAEILDESRGAGHFLEGDAGLLREVKLQHAEHDHIEGEMSVERRARMREVFDLPDLTINIGDFIYFNGDFKLTLGDTFTANAYTGIDRVIIRSAVPAKASEAYIILC